MNSSQATPTEVNAKEIHLKGVKLKDRFVLISKFALVIAVFFWLFKKGLITTSSFEKLFASPMALAVCVLLWIFNTAFGAFRWQILLRTQGAELSFFEVLKLNLVGAFFNIALPGAVSGDLVKAVHVAKKFKDKRAAVFGSMLFDRILGVSSMVFVGAFSAFLSLMVPWGGQLPSVLLFSVGGIGLAAIVFFTYLFSSHGHDPIFHLLRFFTKRHPKLSSLDRLYLGVMS